MDSWTPAQLALMKSGGNGKCAAYLQSKGIGSSTPIKQKYDNPTAQLYKEILKARAEGRPEPTELPPPRNRQTYSTPVSGPPAAAGSGQDPNGMERLAGESEEAYIARQTRLRDDAKARMAAKFGSGGLSGAGPGGSRMQGIGSDPNYNPHGGYGGSSQGGVDINAMTGSFVSGLGSAWSTLGSVTNSVSAQASSMYHDENNRQKLNEIRGSVTSTGLGLWGSLSAAASEISKSVTQTSDNSSFGDDGLSEFQQRMHSQRTNKYSGFGSDSQQMNVNNNTNMSNQSTMASKTPPTTNTNNNGPLPGEDPNGVAPLTGETDQQYIERQTRIREEAKARMAAKFGNGNSMQGVGSGSHNQPAPSFASKPALSMSNSSSRPSQNQSSSSAPKVAKPVKQPKTESSEDFFASFGA